MSHSEDRKTLKELLAGGGRHIGAALAGLLTYPIVARVLSAEGLGAWALLGAAAFLLNLSDLGLVVSIQRAAVAQELGRARRILALSLAVLLVVVPLVSLVGYFFLLDLPEEGTTAAFRADAKNAAVVALLAGGVMAFTSPYRGFVYARGGIRQVANARTLASITQVLVILGGFALVKSLVVPATGLLAGYLLDFALTLRAARAIDPQLPLRPALPTDRRELFSALRDGAAQLVVNLSVVTALRVDLFVLVRYAPLAVVGAYGVAGRAVDQAYLLTKQATVALMPRLGDPERRERAVRIGTGVFGGVMVSGMIALALCGQPLLVAWVGDVAAGEIPAIVLALLAAAAILMSTYEVASSMVMLSAPTGWSCAIPIVIGSAINLTLSVTGAPHFGVWAVAGSTIVGNAVTLLLMWRAARGLLQWNAARLTLTLAPALAAAIVALPAGLLFRDFAMGGLVPSLLGCVVTGLGGLGAATLTLRLATRRTSWAT